MPILYVLSGPDIGRTFDVADGAVLGRTAKCDVGLKGSAVSRQHARVEERADGWYLVDLDSRNGIVQDGRRLSEFALEDGGSFEVGDVELRFRMQEQGVHVAPPPPSPSSVTLDIEPETAVEEDDGPDEPLSDEIEFEGEELFEEPPPRPAASAPQPAAAAPPVRGPGKAPAPEGARGKAAPSREAQRLAAAGIRARPGAESGRVHDGSRPVLQFTRQGGSGGALGSDLAQLPLWARVAAGLAAIAVFVGLFYAAFQLTGSLKERSFGDAEPELVDDAPDAGGE